MHKMRRGSRGSARRGMLGDRRGVAAVEFALIAPALIILFMGVLELTFRFRAAEETTRYVHQVADLISREQTTNTATLTAIYDASVHMMKPLETTDKLDLDVSAIGYRNDEHLTPHLLWRRTAGTAIPMALSEANGLGAANESVIRVAVRYRYTSPLTTLFSGPDIEIVRESYARPRQVRLIQMDGQFDTNGQTVAFGS
ncbi:MAG: TadE/TadG family type IV pilus assembly protein [Hyphomonadaceae bacterium]